MSDDAGISLVVFDDEPQPYTDPTPSVRPANRPRPCVVNGILRVPPIPDGYHTVTAYLIIKDAARAIDFYKKAFGAAELMRFEGPGGKLGHAEIRIGDSPIMLADEHPEMGYRSPQALGGTPVSLLLYVPDVDALFQQAVAAGATVQRPLQDQFYGDRTATLADPFGHVWTIATHKEDVSLEEVKRRFEEFHKRQGGA
jgi:PhnB protein